MPYLPSAPCVPAPPYMHSKVPPSSPSQSSEQTHPPSIPLWTHKLQSPPPTQLYPRSPPTRKDSGAGSARTRVCRGRGSGCIVLRRVSVRFLKTTSPQRSPSLKGKHGEEGEIGGGTYRSHTVPDTSYYRSSHSLAVAAAVRRGRTSGRRSRIARLL